ncbi:resolvase [Halorubrum coriense DSM 10284]|uniref:Resolvase n=1 Tax=Halorubrum coriense DSM 10284 TaxID=1227466 RepID=M0ELX2_9EURY|nr:hypothetical protein [Halorubrum coriense]ELZ47892.1 resolvase [Halorubrum coriense DSM 10284]
MAQETLVYLTGSSDEMIAEQYEQCVELIEHRTDKSLGEGGKADHLRRLKRSAAVNVPIADDDKPDIRFVAERLDIDRDGETAGEVMSTAFGQGVGEMIVADAKPHIIQASQAYEYLRKVDKLTIASKRITIERGASPETIHRTMAAVKTRKTTRNDDEILKEQWSGGRPPVATEVIDGQLVKGDNYHDVRELIHRVVFDDLSKSEASRQIGCTRRTITNTINKRPDLFDIPQQ